MKPLEIRFGAGPEFPHLPQGREPGGQSLRSRTGGSFWAWLELIVGTGLYAAGVWAAAGGRGSRFDRQEELFGGLFLAGMGLLCVYVGVVTWEKGRPKRHPRLRGTRLVVDGETLRRGEEVEVTFTGRASDDRLEVGVACDERYDTQVPVYVKGVSTVIRQTADGTVHEQWQSVSAGSVEQTFTFHIPADAPYSYEGDCVSYAWRISARAVEALREDPRLDQPIWVQP